MKLSKMLTLLLAFVMVFSVFMAGCNQDSEDVTPPATDSSDATDATDDAEETVKLEPITFTMF